jgi:hypothetical protein
LTAYISIIKKGGFNRLVTLQAVVVAQLFLSLSNTFKTKKNLYDASLMSYLSCINVGVLRRVKIKWVAAIIQNSGLATSADIVVLA